MRQLLSSLQITGLLLLCLFSSLGAAAQATIKGTVTDANGQTLSGASVVVQDAKKVLLPI